MGNLPNLKPRDIEKIILRAGFILDKTKGSHKSYYHRKKNLHTTISFHPGTIPQGTLRAIIKQTGLTVDKFLSLRKRKKL